MAGVTSTDRLIATFIAAVTFGIYLCTLFYSIRWLVYTDEGWRIRKRINKTLLSSTLAIFVFSTMHIALAVSGSVVAIRDAERGIKVNPNDPLPWNSVVSCTVKNVAVLLTDAFLIHRCWVVCWKSLPQILIPCFFWIGGLVCTIMQIYWQVVLTSPNVTVWTPVNMSLGPGTILTPFWGTTIIVNIYATSVIVYTLWKSAREQSERSSSSELRFIMRVIIESGVLYLLVTIPHFIVWWTPSAFAIEIMGWIQLPVIGSGFNLIVVRISRHRMEMDSVEKSGKFEISAMQFGHSNSHSNTIAKPKDNISSNSSTFFTD